MYETFYGLRERPFDLTPDPRFLLMTAGHREALTTIQYGISGRKGITLLVGVAGTGKTTLIQAALARQKGQNAKALYLTNPTLTRDEFFQFLALELGLTAWSFPEPLTKETIRLLDPDDYALIVKAADELWAPRTDDERGNSSGNGSTPSREREPSPTS